MTELEALQKAVGVIGGQAETARQLTELIKRPKPITQQHVWHWLNVGKRLPTKYAYAVEHLTAKKGNRISASDLCHDVFSESA